MQDNLRCLTQQTYPVKTIILTIPRSNMRGQPVEQDLPNWLQEEPFLSRVTVLRPEHDYGPILKYIGGKDIVPAGAWVFACDDDQRYAADGIARWLGLVSQDTDILNSSWSLELTARLGCRLISGYNGVLFSRAFMDTILANFDPQLPLCSLRVDDDLVSIYARDNGFRVKTAPVIMDLLYFGATVGEAADSLTFSYNRLRDRHKTHVRMNPQYVRGLCGIVVLASVLIVVVLAALVGAATWARS